MTKTAIGKIRETIMKTIPRSIPIHKIDDENEELTVAVAWGTEAPERLDFPSFVVHFQHISDAARVLDGFEDDAAVENDVTDESHTFNGEAFTVLAEMDVEAIVSVTGTRLGAPFTFETGTDFILIDSDSDGAMDALEWLEDGNVPDEGTEILVSYTHLLLQRTRSHYYRSDVVILSAAHPLRNGEKGATRAYRATEVVEAMHEALVTWFEKDLRPEIEAAGFSLDLSLEADTPIQLRGSNTVQQHHVTQIRWQEDVKTSTSPAVRKITATSEIEYE